VLATLMLFGGRPRMIIERETQSQVPVAKENVEAAIAPAASEVAVLEAKTAKEPATKPTTRRPVPDLVARKVPDIRVGNSSPDQPEYKVMQASTRSASPSLVVPVVANSEKYSSKVTARDNLAEKITNQILNSSRSRKPNNTSGSSDGLAQTVTPTKTLTPVPGLSNPRASQVNNNVQRQWVSGKLVALPMRVLDKNVSTPGLSPNQRMGTWTPPSRMVGRGISGLPR
jgi:hypothetical protein